MFPTFKVFAKYYNFTFVPDEQIPARAPRRAAPDLHTLKNVVMNQPATAQQIFDYALLRMREQGAPGEWMGSGRYRDPMGGPRRCVIGWLLYDAEYSPMMEGNGVSTIILPERLTIHLSLLTSLQQAHDHSMCQSHFMAAFEAQMAIIANKLKLEYAHD